MKVFDEKLSVRETRSTGEAYSGPAERENGRRRVLRKMQSMRAWKRR